MTTNVAVFTRTHTVTYVTDKLLHSVSLLIRESGLSPEKMSRLWPLLEAGVKAWLESRHLTSLIVEVYRPNSPEPGGLVGRWDFMIDYGAEGDGTMSLDTDQIRYHILKVGLWPAQCDYRIVADTKPGAPSVSGWSDTSLRNTTGFTRHGIGTTIDAGSITAGTAFWKRDT